MQPERMLQLLPSKELRKGMPLEDRERGEVTFLLTSEAPGTPPEVKSLRIFPSAPPSRQKSASCKSRASSEQERGVIPASFSSSSCAQGLPNEPTSPLKPARRGLLLCFEVLPVLRGLGGPGSPPGGEEHSGRVRVLD